MKTRVYPNLYRAVVNFITKMSEYCFICAKLLTESEVVTVERGMKTLINASIERADEFSEYLKNHKSVTIHEKCRKTYTRKSSIAASIAKKWDFFVLWHVQIVKAGRALMLNHQQLRIRLITTR